MIIASTYWKDIQDLILDLYQFSNFKTNTKPNTFTAFTQQEAKKRRRILSTTIAYFDPDACSIMKFAFLKFHVEPTGKFLVIFQASAWTQFFFSSIWQKLSLVWRFSPCQKLSIYNTPTRMKRGEYKKW